MCHLDSLAPSANSLFTIELASKKSTNLNFAGFLVCCSVLNGRLKLQERQCRKWLFLCWFDLPAAGKTGTSRDCWFIGCTKDLPAIAWVGFDDHRNLNRRMARSALPIWVEFMKNAYQLFPVRDVRVMYFTPPRGIEIVSINAGSLALASPLSQRQFQEAFIVGAAPTESCLLHSSPPVDF